MDNNQTIEKMKQMHLTAMADMHLESVKNNLLSGSTPDEYLAQLVDQEWDSKQNQKIKRLIKQANFNQNASIADIDYTSNRNLDRGMFQRLITLEFISRNENLINIGPSGVGKSYIAQAIGHQACLMGHRVAYYNTDRLITKMKLAKLDGTYLKELAKLKKIKLLILDDFGLKAFDNNAREVLMDIIDDRYNKLSTIIASQIPVSIWYDIIGEGTIADAILDRVVNSSHRIDLNGESLRKGVLKSI